MPSVGATENIMMAAVRARGLSIIENAAREPEVQDLARMLCAMGAQIRGIGTHVLEIEGVERLHGTEHHVIPDRIEAGSLMVAAAITGGDLFIREAPTAHLEAVIAKLVETGAEVAPGEGGLRVAQRADAAGRIAHATLSRFPDRLAGANDGAADAGVGDVGNLRDDFRKPLHACARPPPHGRPYLHQGTARPHSRPPPSHPPPREPSR